MTKKNIYDLTAEQVEKKDLKNLGKVYIDSRGNENIYFEKRYYIKLNDTSKSDKINYIENAKNIPKIYSNEKTKKKKN